MTILLLALLAIAAFVAGFALGRRSRPPPLAPARTGEATLPVTMRVAFDAVAPRGTRSADLEAHAADWRAAMRGIGQHLADANVRAVVFVHGTFTGTDPLSAYSAVERALPRVGRDLAAALRKRTRATIERVLGDLGNFGTDYVRLFERALGGAIPCTSFVWSSENHHVGRLEAALALVRLLAAHAELAEAAPSSEEREREAPVGAASPRILVVGHSHAGQVFALVTQLLARSIATEAVRDVARIRGLDVEALDADVASLGCAELDFVTFGAPARYAWARVDGVRALHVLAAEASALGGDVIQRLGGGATDLPPLAAEDRRVNASLHAALDGGAPPPSLTEAVRSKPMTPDFGDVVLVDYGPAASAAALPAASLARAITTGLGHGMYTRLDAMLFHARLVTERLYAPVEPATAPRAARGWGARLLRRIAV